MINQDQVLEALCTRHVGQKKAISVARLVHELLGHPGVAADERRVREIVAHLRMHAYPICAHPSKGYFIGETEEEIKETCNYLYSRAMTSLKQVSGLTRRALPDIKGQMGL